jgi:hypothetical protein
MGRKKSKPVEGDSESRSLTGTDETIGSNGGGTMESAGSGKRRGPGRRQNGNSIQGYFRKLLAGHPEWVKERSNEAIYEKWLADHPGETEVPQGVKNGLSNVKSALRSKAKTAQKTRGRPRKVAAAEPSYPDSTPTSIAVVRKAGLNKFEALEALEEQIDECLSVAKSLGKEELHSVIVFLRRARNAVVLKMGE